MTLDGHTEIEMYLETSRKTSVQADICQARSSAVVQPGHVQRLQVIQFYIVWCQHDATF